MNLIKQLEKEQINKAISISKIPVFKTGDVLSVKTLSSKTEKRKQNFLGICISRKNKGLNSSFTIRNIMSGEGVEHTFPLYSPLLIQIQVLSFKRKKTRSSKLYYLRHFANKKLSSININSLSS